MIIDHFPNFIQRVIKNSEDDFYHIVHGCRHCGYAGNLHRHASYHRTIICKEITARVRIQRVICPNCKKTHAIIPSDLIPYFQHTLETIVRLLEFILSKKASYSQSLMIYRMFNLSFSSAHINLYIRRFKSNLNNITYFFISSISFYNKSFYYFLHKIIISIYNNQEYLQLLKNHHHN